MADREKMLEIIMRAYEARGAGDTKGLVAAFHPEGLFNLVGDKSALHLTGSVEGQPSLLAAFGQFIDDFAFEKRVILTTLVDGDRAAVQSRVTIRHNPSGKVFTTELLDLFKFRDGLIDELIEYADTAQIKAIIA